jgi:molecular chaperone GrpE (heat shock protein)
MKVMNENNAIPQKLYEEFANFQKTMEELNLLKRVAADLKNYRKMIKLKRYD